VCAQDAAFVVEMQYWKNIYQSEDKSDELKAKLKEVLDIKALSKALGLEALTATITVVPDDSTMADRHNELDKPVAVANPAVALVKAQGETRTIKPLKVKLDEYTEATMSSLVIKEDQRVIKAREKRECILRLVCGRRLARKAVG
jgi:hypothetical protein